MQKLTSTNTIFGTVFACFLTLASCATDEDPLVRVQEEETTATRELNTSQAYAYVEEMPAFKGGEAALLGFLGQHIRYPEAAQKAGIEGLTVVSFVVETDGSVTSVQTIKSLSTETDQEAARVVKLTSGSWTPGKQDGEPVRVQYTLPVKFSMK
ncbi:protein TonB [Pontibacter ummariensis]|uniref:Protein TonB n=1 Tax=Pontibacter ummariensis TaxID=1610492 RepID=A0A239KGX2_9BACT|nr:energy transducer TonB [Pontibacter ummariensis]PRY05739.1 protein TonB [Pontibacter ummariensis]SNT17636.1 protein TonB [Pontibacter ummariensis]